MNILPNLYRHSLALLTDLYQLTMAYAYWKNGLADREAVFQLTFRHHPFGGQYAIACGLSYVIDFLQALAFTEDDLGYLQSLMGADGKPLFEPGFLRHLAELKFRCDVDAISEGTLVFAGEPLVRVRGPLLQSQIVETAILNMVNFQTLIATKAARVCRAAQGRPVLEFGLRRAQGIDGGLAASRAAYIGGCAGTSNVLAGKLFGIPVRGTHAHSWVMAFDHEREAFQAYAAALPGNCIFLVDTYDSVTGVRNAIATAHELRLHGHELIGIRLDSGDFVSLSHASRRLLDEAGFPTAAVVVSGDLDEHRIEQLLESGAPISVWGVGTRLVTGHEQPALGGVYKLAALRDAQGHWQYKLKLSEEGGKQSDPGILQVRRFRSPTGRLLADVVYDEPTGWSKPARWVPIGTEAAQQLPDHAQSEDLLVPVFRQGQPVYSPPEASQARAHCQAQLACCDDTLLRIRDPSSYLIGFECGLFDQRRRLFDAANALRSDRDQAE